MNIEMATRRRRRCAITSATTTTSARTKGSDTARHLWYTAHAALMTPPIDW